MEVSPKVPVGCALILCCVLFSVTSLNNSGKLFDDFIVKFNKPYDKGSSVYKHRYEIFRKSLQRHEILNKQRLNSEDAQFGITKFSDLTAEEFKQQVLGHPVPFNSFNLNLSKTPQLETFSKLLVNVSAKYDLRSRKPSVLTSVKNQLSCGGCWAFSIVECIETQLAFKTKKLYDLSPQQLIDCSGDAGNSGCKGGNICNTLRWLNQTKTQIVTEQKYPFKGVTDSCDLPMKPHGKVHVTNYSCQSYINREDEMVFQLANQGPLSVAVDATAWQDYLGGIIQHHCFSGANNHAVQIVGYDKTGSVPYYIVRNSWGKDWGLNGYLYIKIGGDLCGISNTVGTVIV